MLDDAPAKNVFFACVPIRFPNAAVAVVAPVPPFAIGKVPLYEVAVTAPHDGAFDPFDIKTCPEVPAAV